MSDVPKGDEERREESAREAAAAASLEAQSAERARDELATTVEELRVAEEELRQQNEELRETRDAVARERQRYLDLFELAPDGYLVTDTTGVIRQANQAAARLLNVPAQRLAAKPLTTFAAPQSLRSFRARLAQLARGGDVHGWEVCFRPRRRDAFDAALTVSPRKGPDGNVEALWWLVRDISEQKRAEEEIRELNAGLERRVRERTAQLDEANQAKDRFLAMLSHELRNPLAAILIASEILRKADFPDPRLRRARDTIDRQARHQAHLLDDLLNVTRIARGKITLHPERLDLGRLVTEAVQDWEDAARDAGLALTSEKPESPLWVEVDPTRLSQVLSNLLHNAVKFTQPGGEVSVRLEARPDEGTAVIRVRDTGTGIAPEMLPHLFTPFTQADRSLGRTAGGLGLGLALVKGLVEMHGGTVSAASEGPGKGSEFTVTLPLASDSAKPEGVPEEAHAKGPLRVLIVEDNKDSADTLRDILELHGREAEVAYTGEAGVEKARQWRPDVVICDIGLPGIDGYEVARRLRADPATASLRLIALSGYGLDQDRAQSRAAGFDRHLVKPIDFDRLERTLVDDREA